MRRLFLVLSSFAFLAACGHGKARTSIPSSNNSSAKVSKKELEGVASYYAEPYNGRRTASGEIFDTYNAMTAAHKTLPFNTVVRVRNLSNGEEVDVRINDRGPFVKGRVIDLSLLAAKEIGLDRAGIAPVKLKVLKNGSPTSIPTSSPKPIAPAAVPVLSAAPPPPPPALPIPAPPAPDPPVPFVPDPVPIEPDTPAPIAIAPSNAPVYGVQVGAFQSESAATKLRDDLATRYSDVSIQTVVADQTLFRVRVGRAPDMDTAEQIAKKLRDEHLNTFVVRLN